MRGGCWEETVLPLAGVKGEFLNLSPNALRQGNQDNFFWRVWQMVERMKGGLFQANPADCGYCPFSAICRLGD
jgi:hypothetical protein